MTFQSQQKFYAVNRHGQKRLEPSSHTGAVQGINAWNN